MNLRLFENEVFCRAGIHRPGVSFVISLLVITVGICLHVSPVRAFEFGNSELQGSLDTTISHGLTYRVEKQNAELTADSNGNDGNLNYNRGIVSNATKFVTDLSLNHDHWGVFVRTTGFLDFENRGGERDRTPLSDDAMERVGKNVEALDAYVYAGTTHHDTAIDFRIGNHVLNWGESTFIPNGVSVINPLDVSKLRLPGSELREALLPVGMMSVTVEPSDHLSISGFYQYDWEETRIDPVGSYFSSTDYAGPGASKAVIEPVLQGLLPEQPQQWDQGYGFAEPIRNVINADLAGYQVRHPVTGGLVPNPQALLPAFDNDFASVRRGLDDTPDHGGQYGLALHYLAEDLNDTEFGFYFINYHSRLPTIRATHSPKEALQAGLAAADAVSRPTSATLGALTQQVTAEVQRDVQAGLISPNAMPQAIKQGVSKAVAGISSALAIDRYAKGGEYQLEYAEDIRLFGLSFNTALPGSGWALQGEYSYRQDAPLQIAERIVLQDGLKPVSTALGLSATDQQSLVDYLNRYQPETVRGHLKKDVSQIQATATRIFGPAMGADGLVLVAEAALMYVHDMPETPLESPAGGTLSTEDADADSTSWGYRVAARLDYLNAVGAINLYPYAQFLHDVSGNSPAPSGPFVEGRMALTLGFQADYLNRWEANLGYTQYAGDGNELSDRDFITASLKYSF